MSGALTRSEFEAAGKALVRKYKQRSDDAFLAPILGGWTWAEHPTQPNLGFLARDGGTHFNPVQNDDEAPVQEITVPDDEATLSFTAPLNSGLVIRQYVAFSATFQVPALYFSINKPNGSPLSLNEIVKTSFLHRGIFPAHVETDFALQLPALCFPVLSQGDHPTLGTPCWYIHPCETAGAMLELLAERPIEGRGSERRLQWLERWFTLMSAVVDLRC